MRAQVWLKEHIACWRAGAELSVVLALVYLCDRTTALPAAAKVRDARHFWALWWLLVALAGLSVRRLEEAQPLAREQTDEWKGWMQVMFLMRPGLGVYIGPWELWESGARYHYFDAKEVYNAIRVYIAAYVWMTGYGNFSLYRKGKSFTVRRCAQMLFRLNFLGCLVCVVLRNEYMLYYICAMHTLFTLFVLLAMYVAKKLNSSYWALWIKILATLGITVIIYDGPDVIFRWIFGTLPLVRPLFAFHDPLHPEFTDEMHEFHFRSGLDRYIWIFGMVCALHFESAASFYQRLGGFSCFRRTAIQVLVVLAALGCGGLWWKYVFQLEKLSYNKLHPYTSDAQDLKATQHHLRRRKTS